MTVPSGARRNWCPSCEETCDDHSRICVVCGTELQYPRVAAAAAEAGAGSDAHANASALPPPPRVNLLPVPSELTNEALSEASRELRERIGTIRSRIRETHDEQMHLLTEIAAMQEAFWHNDEQQQIPAAWLDPAGVGGGGSKRPTSKECLDRLPRIVLRDKSSLLRRAGLRFFPGERGGVVTTREMTAVPGEFGPSMKAMAGTANASGGDAAVGSHPTSSGGRSKTVDRSAPVSAAKVLSNARLVVAEPRTGKGGRLSDETIRAVRQAAAAPQQQHQEESASTPSSSSATPATAAAVVVYFERGDNVTFVRKALLAQNVSPAVAAVVIGNNRAEPWPYTMQDPKNEAAGAAAASTKNGGSGGGGGLRIPVVMVKQSDGRDIVDMYNQQQRSSDDLQSPSPFLRCSLTIEASDRDHECVICREAFEEGQTVVRIPWCGHVFHFEPCAMMWLGSHNTCPYCRFELPTDDEEYEGERRRRQQQQPTRPGGGSEGGGAYEFYG